MLTENFPRPVTRRQRAARLAALHRARHALEAELAVDGCDFRGRVDRRHRALSHAIDVIEAAIQTAWMEAA